MLLHVHGRPAAIDTAGAAFGPARPSIVLVHGALNDHTVWHGVAPALAASGLNVLAVDLPGHGASAGPALATVEAMADWLLALLDAAGIGRAVLAGHSLGSLVALDCAARAPERVRALALLGTVWPMQVSGDLLARARDDEAAAIEIVTAWSHAPADTLPPGAGTRLQDATRTLMRRVAQAGPPHLLHTDLAACNDYAGGAAAAGALACPVLFILGSRDVMTPARRAAPLAAALPRARVVTVDAGHQLMAEQPDAVAAALCAFAADFATAADSATLG